MSFLRSGAQETLRRWRDTIAGLALAGLGLWWLLGVGGIMAGIGAVLAVAGAALALAGLQRARFAREGKGPGLVELREGAIGYFGPTEGGVRALDEIAALVIDCDRGTPAWVLRCPGQPDLSIPLDALGADRLFDAFSTLPGLAPQRLVNAAESARRAGGTGAARIVWRRPAPAARLRRLR